MVRSSSVEYASYFDRIEQAQVLAEIVKNQTKQQLQLNSSGKVSMALAGGTTPKLFLQELSQQELAWKNVVITLTDERKVSASNVRSNAKFVKDFLFQNKARDATFQPLYEEKSNPEFIQEKLTSIFPFDICVLGMGADGHFASLFPQATNLNEAYKSNQIMMDMHGNQLPEPRVSLTLNSIVSSRYIHILIQGKEKYEAYQKALNDKNYQEMPIRLLLHNSLLSLELKEKVLPTVWVHYCP